MMTGDSSSSGNINGGAHGLHLVMFPFLAFGHISPFIQLSRKLTAVDPAIRITFLTTPGNVSRISTSLLPSSAGSCGTTPTPSISNAISIRSLPLPPVPGLPPGAESTADLPNMAQAELLKTAVDAMKPDVGALLSHLRPHFVVFDFAMPWIPSVCSPLGINSLFFTVFSAIANAYLMVPSRRLLMIHDLKMPPPDFPATSAISVAGGVPAYQAQDFSYVFKTFGDDKPSVYDRFVACMTGCSAIITKTCTEMEGRYISYLESEYNKPVLLAGPVVPEPAASGGEVLEERWAKWLDKFEKGSVIYCSFGSETSLTEEATRELILGLQMTNMPYFVVLINNNNNLDDIMVEAADRGLVHSGWVQQQLILRHESVGCYVNHGGFSSVVEGLVAGCRLVMLPQRGDQYLNSVLFARELGIGVEVERDEMTGAFKKEGVCEAVKKVMIPKKKEESGGYERWKEFFTDKDMEEQFMLEFVKKLKAFSTNKYN